ncbi:hypothetical protein Mro03_74790 [Microbispora rosea subsp. rosea]|nr:hypothetical protein Mro03_74790 [Microbispora rosea subsp. rosea]
MCVVVGVAGDAQATAVSGPCSCRRGQSDGLNDETRFFEDFSAEAIADGLPQLEDSARRLPITVVGSSGEQDGVMVVDDYAGNAHRVAFVAPGQMSPPADRLEGSKRADESRSGAWPVTRGPGK